MAKQIVRKIKLQIDAGKASPAPPVGTMLGPAGINTQEFCTKFNDQTRDQMGNILPVEVILYDDRSFDFVVKTPPAAFLIKKYANVNKGSGTGTLEMVGKITKAQIKEIAELKMKDLTAYNLESAMSSIEGTAKNMGIEVVE